MRKQDPDRLGVPVRAGLVERRATMTVDEICQFPVSQLADTEQTAVRFS